MLETFLNILLVVLIIAFIVNLIRPHVKIYKVDEDFNNDERDLHISLIKSFIYNRKQKYAAINSETESAVCFDIDECRLLESDLEDGDGKNYLMIFTEDELNSLGIYKSDEKYIWLPMEYQYKFTDIDLNN